MDADQEPSEPLFAWYQRTEPEGDTTWKAALEGSAVNPDADAESAPDPVPRSSFTSGRETLNELCPQGKESTPLRSHHILSS